MIVPSPPDALPHLGVRVRVRVRVRVSIRVRVRVSVRVSASVWAIKDARMSVSWVRVRVNPDQTP